MSIVHALPGEELLRKFHESQPRQRTKVQMDIPRVKRGRKEFPTGSKYEGYWNVLGISGYGVYTYPVSGVKYEGNFEDGLFHGEGQFVYPSGVILKGVFRNGEMLNKAVLVFPDGVEYRERHWKYCAPPDRRYSAEHDYGIPAGGESLATAKEGLKCVHFATTTTSDDTTESSKDIPPPRLRGILRNPTPAETRWIEQNRGRLEPQAVGPCPEFYEAWQEPMLLLAGAPPALTRPEESRTRIYAQRESRAVSFASHQDSESDQSKESSSSVLEFRHAKVSAELHENSKINLPSLTQLPKIK